jgi:8-oxo-dGTP pyrophosphatase MutT (NUDIX family)
VILVRDGYGGLQVLLVKRSPHARFMAATWVFPGGALEKEAAGAEDEQALDLAHRQAAVRELREEAGVVLAGPEEELVEFAHWITPAPLSVRFDARFFLARLPAGSEPQVDGEECVDLCWLRPREALARARAGKLRLAFPTVKQMEQLSAFASVDELIESARGRTVTAVEPRVRVRGGSPEILLPGEPGYDEAEGSA